MNVYEANIERGMPTVEQARIRLDQALRTARQQRHPVIKIIHGYGSTGKGGAIKKDVLVLLSQEKNKGKIKNYIAGEDFSPFDATARQMLNEYPLLRKDKDYSRNNAGITIVLM